MTGPRQDRASATSPLAAAGVQPAQREKQPPCASGCLSGGDVRGWIGIVAQRHKLGLTEEQAYRQAWETVASLNPFPATMGRICPHPCETQCNRGDTDGAVAINALERFLGDWALEARTPLPRLDPRGAWTESIGVIGAGPAGLSFAYQMARRGYQVTVYEREDTPGGMLQHGIPEYRLPEKVLAAEVARILDLGVALRLKTAVGREITTSELRERHTLLFLGIGAGRGLRLGIPGDEGPGSWTGTTYLAQVSRGGPADMGRHVVVVGGGNTAVDAARTARRTGAGVTLLYRRTRSEMPAIDAEVEDALVEGVDIQFLAAPVAILREFGMVRSVVVRRMALGEPDASGRRAPVPIPDSDFELMADSVIAAVSQQPDWDGLDDLRTASTWVEAAPDGHCGRGVWAGGDARGPGVAGLAIRQGREAAEAAHARLRGLAVAPTPLGEPVSSDMVKPAFHPEARPVVPPERPQNEWLAFPDAELRGTIGETAFLQEVARCFSCGSCYGCQQCFMYCGAGGITPIAEPARGAYFRVRSDLCLSCGQCVDLCPSGFLTPT